MRSASRTAWKLITGAVAITLLLLSYAGAMAFQRWPGGELVAQCRSHYRPHLVIDECEDGQLEVPAGIRSFTFTVAVRGEMSPPGCPQMTATGVVSATVYRRRRGRVAPVATVSGATSIANLPVGTSQQFVLKWIQGGSRSGDRGFIQVQAPPDLDVPMRITCPVLVM